MIKTKEQLKEYIAADLSAMHCQKVNFFLPGKEVQKFVVCLRYVEYYEYVKKNCFFCILPYFFWRIMLHKLSVKCGFDICIGTFGKGLNIHHRGTIVVNKHARIGDYCDLLPGVVIGQNGTSDDVPTIGNHCYIGTGAKIIGKITIADDVAIGANSVVNKSFKQKGVSIAGVPAKVIGMKKTLL